MSTVAFDTLAFAKRLQEAGVPSAQAEAHASAQADFLTHHLLSEVATKTDLKALEGTTKAEFKALRAELKADVKALRADTKAEFALVRGDIVSLRKDTKADLAELETRLTLRMLVMVGALATLMTFFKFME